VKATSKLNSFKDVVKMIIISKARKCISTHSFSLYKQFKSTWKQTTCILYKTIQLCIWYCPHSI